MDSYIFEANFTERSCGTWESWSIISKFEFRARNFIWIILAITQLSLVLGSDACRGANHNVSM